jgi:CRP-like cAMP-binding protein/ferredoxin-like protein FixX
MSEGAPLGKTAIKRMELHRDRWSSLGGQSGIVDILDRLPAAELQKIDLFKDYDEKFLERISPDVSVAMWSEGAVLFEQGTYIDVAFFVDEGEVEVWVEGVGESAGPRPIFDLSRTVAPEAEDDRERRRDPGSTMLMKRATRSGAGEITLLATMDFDLPRGGATRLGTGEILGEIGAMSGWPQSITARTATACRLVQVRVPALRLMKRKSKELKARLDQLYRERSLAAQLKSTPLFAGCNELVMEALKEEVELISLEPGEVLMEEGATAEDLYVVRSGFLKLSQSFEAGSLSVSYLSKGMTLGEIELLVDGVDSWQATAESVEFTELVRMPRAISNRILDSDPGLREQLWASAVERIKETGAARRHITQSEFVQVALDNGLVQGSSILAIDLNACTRCDDCVKACADTHGGRPRFVREGNRYENLLIAKSCYHCRDPVCLVGCPTGAIHRAGVGDVVEIDEEVCIGCSTCFRNCPYDAIVMWETGESWPDDMVPEGLRGKERQSASKCDLCHDTGHGPACVINCPQGCAYRVGSLEEFRVLLEERK